MAVGNGSSLEYWIKLISVKVGSWKGEGCWAALKPKVDLSRLAKYANEMVINANNIYFQFDLLPRLNAIGNPSSTNNTVFLYITITIVVKEAKMLNLCYKCALISWIYTFITEQYTY